MISRLGLLRSKTLGCVGSRLLGWRRRPGTFSVGLAGVAQSAECLHGKEEVRGSIPLSGSIQKLDARLARSVAPALG